MFPFKTIATAVALALPYTVEAMTLPGGPEGTEPAGELAQVAVDWRVSAEYQLKSFYDDIATWRRRGRIKVGKWLQS